MNEKLEPATVNYPITWVDLNHFFSDPNLSLTEKLKRLNEPFTYFDALGSPQTYIKIDAVMDFLSRKGFNHFANIIYILNEVFFSFYLPYVDITLIRIERTITESINPVFPLSNEHKHIISLLREGLINKFNEKYKPVFESEWKAVKEWMEGQDER